MISGRPICLWYIERTVRREELKSSARRPKNDELDWSDSKDMKKGTSRKQNVSCQEVAEVMTVVGGHGRTKGNWSSFWVKAIEEWQEEERKRKREWALKGHEKFCGNGLDILVQGNVAVQVYSLTEPEWEVADVGFICTEILADACIWKNAIVFAYLNLQPVLGPEAEAELPPDLQLPPPVSILP